MADAPILKELIDKEEGEYRRVETGQTIAQFDPMRMEEENVEGAEAGEDEMDDMSKFSLDYSLDDKFVQAIMNFQPIDFDPVEDLFDDSTVVLFGRRRIGKSFCAKWIMWSLRYRLPWGIVITNTKVNDFWQSIVPGQFVHDVKHMDAVLEALFERQTFILKNKHLNIDPRTFVVLDDVLREEQMIRYSKNLRALFTDGRHFKIFTLVTTQYAKGVPTEVRGNTDCAIVSQEAPRGIENITSAQQSGRPGFNSWRGQT